MPDVQISGESVLSKTEQRRQLPRYQNIRAETTTDHFGAGLIIGVSERRVYEILTKDPSFPRPIAIGKSRRFLVDEVRAWLKQQPRTSGAPEPAQLAAGKARKREQVPA